MSPVTVYCQSKIPIPPPRKCTLKTDLKADAHQTAMVNARNVERKTPTVSLLLYT